MNKRIKIMCLSVLSLSLLSGMQVQAWPSFKKLAGYSVLAVGACVLWQKRNIIKANIQEQKDKAQKWVKDKKAKQWFKDRFEDCKGKMNDTKDSIAQTLAEKKDSLQNWIEEKSNNSGLSNFFARFQRDETAVNEDAAEAKKAQQRTMITSSSSIDFCADDCKEPNVA